MEQDSERERDRLNHAHTRLAQTQALRAKEAAVQEARARRTLREMKQDVNMEEVTIKYKSHVYIVSDFLCFSTPLFKW